MFLKNLCLLFKKS